MPQPNDNLHLEPSNDTPRSRYEQSRPGTGISRTARWIIGVVGGIILLGLTWMGAGMIADMKQPQPKTAAPVRIKTVEVQPARNTTIPSTLDVQGELVAYNKIGIFSEVGGTLVETERPFKQGTYFPKGSVLARIDAEEARLNLLSQRANLMNAITAIMPDLKIDYAEEFPQWEQYLMSFDPERSTPKLPATTSDRAKLFVASRNLQSQYYSIKSAEERLSKYVITAPFGGVLTEANINPGAVVRVGQQLGELMNAATYELAATVPTRDLNYISAGDKVQLFSNDIGGPWSGTVSRIDAQVDPGTQTVTVFIRVSGKGLREGMYLRGEVATDPIENALVVPRASIIDQRGVYTVRDSTLEIQPVQIVKIDGDDAIVRGIPEGTPLVQGTVGGAYEGMRVDVKM